MRIKQTDKVQRILTHHPEARDNDEYLLYYFYADELVELSGNPKFKFDTCNKHRNPSPENISLKDFLLLWKKKHISHPSAIMRARRKVQQEHPDTRGAVWNKRHEKQEQIQEDLGYAKNRS